MMGDTLYFTLAAAHAFARFTFQSAIVMLLSALMCARESSLVGRWWRCSRRKFLAPFFGEFLNDTSDFDIQFSLPFVFDCMEAVGAKDVRQLSVATGWAILYVLIASSAFVSFVEADHED